jgi:signal transduction histidine kinase
VLVRGLQPYELILLAYGPLSTLALALSPALRRNPVAWFADCAIVLAMVLESGDWRSPYYPLWLTTLPLPAVQVRLRWAVWLAAAVTLVYASLAAVGGPAPPGDFGAISYETLAIHLLLPFALVSGLAYAAESLRQLRAERARRERLAIEAERRRIAWELHDSAKQRVHAAHLMVSSLQRRLDGDLAHAVERAAVELESAAADMDTSLAELRSPLEGRPLHEALRARADELAEPNGPHIAVHGAAAELPPLVAAHVYRIGCEALTNALRHAGANAIDVAVEQDAQALRVLVRDDGQGLPDVRRPDASGLLAMESRAATIGAHLSIEPGLAGRGTVVALEVPATVLGGAA